VPILPVYCNYGRRLIGFLPQVQPGDDVAAGVEAARQQLQRHGARRKR